MKKKIQTNVVHNKQRNKTILNYKETIFSKHVSLQKKKEHQNV